MDRERAKNISTIIVAVFLLSIIPITLLFSRETAAELNFPIEAKVIAEPRLNIRKTPDLSQSPIGSIATGQEILLLEHAEGQAINGDTNWYRIDFRNQDGYVSAQYIEFSPWSFDLPPTANDQDFENYLEEQGFPHSYRAGLRELHRKYPNWIFTPIKLNVDFNSAVNGQYKPENSMNFVPATSEDALKSTSSADFNKETNEWIEKERGWVAASKEIIAHQLDPRNFLDEQHIFQFESLSYNADVQNWQGIRNQLAGTFMDSDEYANIFCNAAEISLVSPYHLIARVRQEVSPNGSGSSSGTYPGVEGYYNFFNIGAYGADPVYEGLVFARDGYKNNPAANERLLIPWDTPEKSIKGGAIFLGRDYINNLQNTLYFQKFDLRHGPDYWHQYMANVFAPQSEARTMYHAYSTQGSLAESKEFLIPIFTSISELPAPYPTGGSGTPNNWLRSISIDGALLPGFESSTYSYSIEVHAPNSEITIDATPYNPYAVVTGRGSYFLKEGKNKILITVTATNGSIRNYEIIVNYHGETTAEVPRVESSVYQIQPDGNIYGLDFSRNLNLVENVLNNITTTDQYSLSIVDCADQEVTKGSIATGYKLLQKQNGEIVGKYTFIVIGDVNCDGDIDILDVDSIYRYLTGYLNLNDAQLLAANALQDSEVDILDADQIYRSVLGYVQVSQNLEPLSE
ncbi:MAG TPA: SH3 domain-containing protein [Clostridiaceae bacterium]|nr:SH3 domain-containing protein [Clostridiaceae bacterium]